MQGPQSFLTVSRPDAPSAAWHADRRRRTGSLWSRKRTGSQRSSAPERFTIEEACDLANRGSQAFPAVAGARDTCPTLICHRRQASKSRRSMLGAETNAQRHVRITARICCSTCLGGNAKTGQRFITDVKRTSGGAGSCLAFWSKEPDAECLELIGRTAEMSERLKLSTIHPDSLRGRVDAGAISVLTARPFRRCFGRWQKAVRKAELVIERYREGARPGEGNRSTLETSAIASNEPRTPGMQLRRLLVGSERCHAGSFDRNPRSAF